MTKKEKEYIRTTLSDKKEEIQKCLKHYDAIANTNEILYFRGQLDLIKELETEYFQEYIK